MPSHKPDTEVEIKLAVSDIQKLRRRLKQLRAREISPRTFESNTLYDTPKKSLRRHGGMLRLRIERPGSAARLGARRKAGVLARQEGRAILTYKGPMKYSGSK